MSLTSELTIGVVTYLILQALTFCFNSNGENITRYGYTNLISTFIWCNGIILFLKRIKNVGFNLLQNVDNHFVRLLLCISLVFITIEYFLTVWGCIETVVLKWLPDAATYVGKRFGYEETIWEWPFVLLLWVISSYCVNYANNTDRYIAYYQRYFNDQADIADNISDDGGDGLETRVLAANHRCRSKYTHYTCPSLSSSLGSVNSFTTLDFYNP